MTVRTYVSPSLNGLGDDRPLGLGLQIDGGAAQTRYFVPATAKGASAPAPWGGVNGWVANSIIEVPFVFPVQPGAHTLKVSVSAKLSIGMRRADEDCSEGVDDRADGGGAENRHRWVFVHRSDVLRCADGARACRHGRSEGELPRPAGKCSRMIRDNIRVVTCVGASYCVLRLS